MREIAGNLSRLRSNKKSLWTVAMVAIVALAVIIMFRERDQRSALTVTRSPSYIEGLRIVDKKHGATSWEITARKAELTTDESVAHLFTIAMSNKKSGVSIQADTGVYNIISKGLALEKNITVWMKDYVITAEEMSWDPAQRALLSDNTVRIVGKNFEIQGEGLLATEQRHVTLNRNVRAVFF